MSGHEERDHSILLPDAKLTVFSTDENTLDVVKALEKDWRFARVEISAEQGGVEEAISAYAHTASPDLVVVQTDTIDESLTDKLDSLASNCSEGTAAIIIGPVNDVHLYRKLIDLGVSDYLVKPLEEKLFANVVAKTLIDKLGVSGSRLISFLGAKGGVGTTTLAQASAWGAAESLNQKTLLMDVSGGWSSLSVGMGFEPLTTLAEAVKAAEHEDVENLQRMLYAASEKLDVLALGGDVMLEKPVLPEQLEKLLDTLLITYPALLVDLSQSPDTLKKTVLRRSNRIVLVTNALLPSLRLTRALIEELKDVRGGSTGEVELVLNMTGLGQAYEVPRDDIEQVLEFRPSGEIKFDPEVFIRAESESKKITESSAGQSIFQEALLPVLQKAMNSEAEAQAVKTEKPGGLFRNITRMFTKENT